MNRHYLITGVVDGEHYTRSIRATDMLTAKEDFESEVFYAIAQEYVDDGAYETLESARSFVDDNFCSPWVLAIAVSQDAINIVHAEGK